MQEKKQNEKYNVQDVNLEILYYTRVRNVKKKTIFKLRDENSIGYQVSSIELGKEKIQKQRIVIARERSVRKENTKKGARCEMRKIQY